MSITNIWAALTTGARAGVLTGGYPFAPALAYVGTGAPSYATTYTTIANAIAGMTNGGLLFLGPQVHQEGPLVIPSTITNLTIIGAGNRGSCRIEPALAASAGLQVLGNDITIINVGISGGASSTHGLLLGNGTVSPTRFRAIGCDFYGPTGVNPAAAVFLVGTLDTIFEDCIFRNCSNCVLFDDATGSVFVRKLTIKNSLFRNFTTVGLGIATGGEVHDMALENNFFGRDDGTVPTDFILLSSNNHTGLIAGNQFANPTNEAAVLTIGTKLLWGPNGTEAGWSTARPA